MTEQIETTTSAGFKNRKSGLIAFGIIEIIFGALCALFVPLMIFGMVMSHTLAQKNGAAVPVNPGSIIFTALLYGLMAAFFLVMGIGSIRARRWARALMLVGSSMWLGVGIGSGVGFVAGRHVG